ncbi:DUF2330 domain-containing protein [soil metagenome]
MSRRFLAMLPLAAVLLGLQVASPAAACACGAPAPIPGSTLEVNQERAIVSFSDAGTESIELQLGVLGTDAEAGLIFPTPSPATVSVGGSSDFVDIEAAIAPRVVYDNEWWIFTGGDGAAGGAPPSVLSEVQLGPITAATLQASDAEGLNDWLTTNGYGISDAVAALLPDYIERGWYFVALKLTSDSVFNGDLDPIVFEFDSDELVYPMDLSKAATDAQDVRLYVFDDHRTTLAPIDAPTAPYLQGEAIWADAAPTGFADRGAYLTVFDLTLDDPSSQATDLTFPQADSDASLEQVSHVSRPLTIGGIPLGVIVILLATILLIIVIAVVVGVRRNRALRRQSYPGLS